MPITDSDKTQIENIVRKEIKSFMDSTQAHTIVIKAIQDELGTKKIDDKIVDLSTKVTGLLPTANISVKNSLFVSRFFSSNVRP